MELKINKLKGSIVEIEGEIGAEVFESFWPKAFKKVSDNFETDGFRKGKVPENILLSKVPEIHILEEAAELALAQEYPKILEREKIDAIDRPEIFITKLARKNPLGFKIKTVVMPEIKLPDYKKIASSANKKQKDSAKELTITDEELESTILDIRKSRAPKVHIKEGAEKDLEVEKESLPPFDDEFVKSLGNFKDVEDFKEKLRENLKTEKENSEREKHRLKIIEEVIEKAEIDLPELLVDLEVEKILARMEADISAMGLKFEDYLKHINKTVDDMKKEFRADGEKRAKLALVLNKISTTENIKADPKDVDQEVAHILEHYKDADPTRARMHSENILTNEKIFQFLETQE